MNEIETDYLVVGAGAAGLAFADALVAEDREADVVIVDRRHSPGGHWNDAYPFVRLHQPAACYGVNSRMLGTDSIDTAGPNAGFYELATGPQICAYFRAVLDDHLLPSGRVRFFGGRDYVGDWSHNHTFTSRLTGRSTTVRVRRKVVNSTYLDVATPATHTPSFATDLDARVVPTGALVDVADSPTGYTVLGAGKTAMDACVWLLDNGVDPDRIRWIKPREAWFLDRASFQPLDLVASTLDGFALAIEAIAEAADVDGLFERAESSGQLVRLDRDVAPTMFRGAILSRCERDALQQIDQVVRQGRVRHVGADHIELESGTIGSSPGELVVDCTASGFRTAPPRPIFEPGRITLQSLQGGFTTYNAALLGFIEAARDDDSEKNRLCRPVPQPNHAADWLASMHGGLQTFALHAMEPDIASWRDRSRLNLTRGLTDHLHEPRVQAAFARMASNTEAALHNGARLLRGASAPLVPQ